MKTNSFVRSIVEIQFLEPRRLLTFVPIELKAAVPFDGLVATNLHLPLDGRAESMAYARPVTSNDPQRNARTGSNVTTVTPLF